MGEFEYTFGYYSNGTNKGNYLRSSGIILTAFLMRKRGEPLLLSIIYSKVLFKLSYLILTLWISDTILISMEGKHEAQ